MTNELTIRTVPQLDPRLGRHLVHDPRSRGFAYPVAPAAALPTHRIRHRIYDPRPTPAQQVGCCTCVDQCLRGNAAGNRVHGTVLNLEDAMRLYTITTSLDDIEGEFPPTDTGSSGLAACKAATQVGFISRYEWIFTRAGGVLAALTDKPVGVGTWWYQDMFQPDPLTLLVKPTGRMVGGHQWSIIGWEPKLQAFEAKCWWGPDFGNNGVFRIRYADLEALLADGGDAHVTYRAGI